MNVKHFSNIFSAHRFVKHQKAYPFIQIQHLRHDSIFVRVEICCHINPGKSFAQNKINAAFTECPSHAVKNAAVNRFFDHA